MKHTDSIAPFLKWVGGKRQLIPVLSTLFPESYTTYCEPFLGGGAMLFALQPEKAIVNDVNGELINVYKVVRDHVDELIAALKKHVNTYEHFQVVRGLDRDAIKYASLSDAEKAARIIYLNKTCFNGLYRVNKKGQFNVPFGSYKNPKILDEPLLRAVSFYLNNNQVSIFNEEYTSVLNKLPEGSFVYLDPPYDPVSDTSNFTSYAKDGFGKEEQIRLRDACTSLNERGIQFMLSNSATPFIMDLYSSFDVQIVHANRFVNSNASGRGKVEEVVVRNYV